MYISTYESCKYLFLEKTRLPRNFGIVLSAAVGDLVAGFLRVPPEVIKQRLQTGIDPCTTVAIRNMYETQVGNLHYLKKRESELCCVGFTRFLPRIHCSSQS